MADDRGGVVFTSEQSPSAVSRAASRGQLVRLAQGVYTGLVHLPPEQVVARHLWQIVAHEMPGAVIVDRSAKAVGPVDGTLIVDYAARTRPLVLPGVTVRPRRGPGPVEGDMPFLEGLYLAGTARQLLDNLDRSRGSAARTLSDAEVEDWIDDLLAERGGDYINRLRDHARTLTKTLARSDAMRRLDALVRAALSTGDAPAVSSPRLSARLSGYPFDPHRVGAFEQLAAYLSAQPPDVLAALPSDEPRRRLLPFYEAYFSNFIEGTEFTLDEAAGIVFAADLPPGRPEDAHDILGTFEVVDDDDEMRRTPGTAAEFEQLLCARHARVMGGRPETLPGHYKQRPNRAGSTEFVAPDLVAGTLRRGFDVGRDLRAPFAQAVYIMFLTSEVHPFADGNGRVARIMMNAELVAAGEVRILVPTVYRSNYLAALKAATHTANYQALEATLRFARRYTAQVDFTSRETAEADFARTNALRDAGEAEDVGVRLVLPSSISRVP